MRDVTTTPVAITPAPRTIEVPDLDELAEISRRFEHRPAETGRGSFIAQVELVQEWRRFPFLDPDLPRELLDHDWSGLRAAAVFHDLHARWHRRAQAEWDRMEAERA